MPSGLDFPSNNTSNCDIRLIWDSTNLLPRDNHTAIWRFYPRQQSGYYAVAWHSPNNGFNTWDNGQYSFGTHPYPSDTGAVDSFGNATNQTGGTGTSHFWEMAGFLAAHDYLTSAGGSGGLLVNKDKWYVQVRRCRRLANGNYEHTFIPDLTGNPNFVITQTISSIGTSGSNPAFYFGSSDWRSGVGGTGFNDETLSGILRGIQLYSDYLPTDIATTEALNDTSNTPQTVSGAYYVWYMNQDPSLADSNDKSGKNHNPRWDNSSRPALWTSATPGVTITIQSISASFSVLNPQINSNSVLSVYSLSGVYTLPNIDFPRVEISSSNIRLRW